MIALSYYLLKVILCSGILYGYYYLVLRDKVFHQWNRFYLLGSVVVSFLLPLVNININTPAQHESKIINALQIVTGADEYVKEVHGRSAFALTAEMLSGIAYTMVSLVILFLFIKALEKIRKVIRRNQAVAIDDFYFLNTAEPGTPFSFFRFLLWNKDIALDTENGKRILEHELVHIREKHSWDKIFIQLVLVLFWINPFYWLIRKELTMIHEFIADRKAIGNGDAQAFARLLLETSFPGYAPMMTHTFFKTSIKRRLTMITKTQHPGFSYLSRLMMIPLLFILLFAFGVKAKTMMADDHAPVSLDHAVTVVIDAGHGGDDAGAISGDLKEKDLNLDMAKLVKALNTNPNIHIVLSRESDYRQQVTDKVIFSEENKANLFLSIHTNAAPSTEKSGFMAYVAGKNLQYNEQNIRFASLLLNNLSALYPTDKSIKQLSERTFYVLDKNICPAVVLECGYLSNAKDVSFISSKQNQEKIARQILRSIEDYFSKTVMLKLAEPVNERVAVNSTDSVPKDKKLKNVTFVYQDGTKETLTPEEYKKKTGNPSINFSSDTIHVNSSSLTVSKNSLPADAVYIVDGKTVSVQAVEKIQPDEISTINVTKSSTQGNTISIVTKTAAKANTSVSINTNTVTNTQVNTATGGTTITVTRADNDAAQPGGSLVITNDPAKPKPMYVLDGKEITEEEMKSFDPNKIASVNVLKGEQAEKSYGSKAKNGVVVISSKK